eukprot:3987486-Ditylum_brightwellii.AAC.1
MTNAPEPTEEEILSAFQAFDIDADENPPPEPTSEPELPVPLLCEMAKDGDYESMKTFFQTDNELIDVDVIDPNKDRSALVWAVLMGEEEIVELLLSPPPLPNGTPRKAANPNASDRLEFFPLWGAAQDGETNIVRLLLEHGADVNQQIDDDEMGRTTPLWMAMIENHVDIVKLLLQHGASPNIPESENHVMPIDMAQMLGFKEICRLLFQHGAMSLPFCTAIPPGK